MTDSKSVEQMAKLCMEYFGENISILVNNAGISTGNTPIEYLGEADWDRVMDTNVKGAFLCSKAVLPYMMKSGPGSVVNVSSAGGLKPYFGGTAYASSKAAMVMLTLVLALEHGKDKIRANCVCPGSISTEMFEEGLKHFANKSAASGRSISTEQIKASIENGIPLGRIGEPDNVANTVLFLSSEEASFINGAVIVIDGGQTL